ncbi:MAG: carboxypeptidase regulatory-like domain-containing protein, partial [Acidobacteriota bacterium]|nr:carboxypeptidase regulatory-like domain-containing protein [Acidobacteriota bacterium]
FPSGDYNADGTSGDRPNAPSSGIKTAGWSRQQFLSGIFPASAFPAPVPGTDGTLGRNTYFGPGFVDVDASLNKRFAIGERVHLQIRIEAFNVLNRVNLNAPVVDLSSNNFGRSTSTLSPRQFQAGLRVEF